jgi:hypothetical protein
MGNGLDVPGTLADGARTLTRKELRAAYTLTYIRRGVHAGHCPRYAGTRYHIGNRIKRIDYQIVNREAGKSKMLYFVSNARLTVKAYHPPINRTRRLERALDAQHALCTLWLTVWYR